MEVLEKVCKMGTVFQYNKEINPNLRWKVLQRDTI